MSEPVTISTFYSFTPLADPAALRAPVLARMQALGICGTLTLASEGINATVSGAPGAIEALMVFLSSLMTFTTPTYRESYDAAQPFKRTKVKVKPELIALGVPTFPTECVGIPVQPGEWNALITRADVMIIDTRNDYEFALGHFAGAINPGTRNFKDMVSFSDRMLDPAQGKTIAMYCTGGIRCEKYSSYLVARGFTQVYHLYGGILAYLETIPPSASLWHGSCFVFDERIGVGHGLAPAEGLAA